MYFSKTHTPKHRLWGEGYIKEGGIILIEMRTQNFLEGLKTKLLLFFRDEFVREGKNAKEGYIDLRDRK